MSKNLGITGTGTLNKLIFSREAGHELFYFCFWRNLPKWFDCLQEEKDIHGHWLTQSKWSSVILLICLERKYTSLKMGCYKRGNLKMEMILNNINGPSKEDNLDWSKFETSIEGWVYLTFILNRTMTGGVVKI